MSVASADLSNSGIRRVYIIRDLKSGRDALLLPNRG
jgi:hypothetical protein